MSKSSIITKKTQMSIPRGKNWRMERVTSPGEMLREEFLIPSKISANRLAEAILVPVSRVHEILHDRRGITADTAMRFSLYFGNSPEFWMNLQSAYDLAEARKSQKRLAKKIIPVELTNA